MDSYATVVTLVAEAPSSVRASFPHMIRSTNIKLTLGICGPYYALQQTVVPMQLDTDHVGPIATNDRGWRLGKALRKQKAHTEK